MLQCVAACCSVLQCVAVCRERICGNVSPTLPGTIVLQGVAVCCSVVKCGAVCCSVLQCVESVYV